MFEELFQQIVEINLFASRPSIRGIKSAGWMDFFVYVNILSPR